MTRLFSFLIATIFLVSATVEIASFAIDHKSWVQENISALRDRFTLPPPAPAPARPDQQAQPACEAACPAAPPQLSARRCEDIEELGKKILCRITLPKTDAACRRDCEQKNRPSVPGNWIRPDSKGKMASAGTLH
jgi:hypothetical protein